MVADLSIERKLQQVRVWNIVVGLILAIQAVAIAILTNSFSLPVTATFMKGPPGAPRSFTISLISLPVGACSVSRPSSRRSPHNRFTPCLPLVQAQFDPEPELRTLD